MAKRYVADLTINQPDNFVWMVVNDFFQKEGFSLKEFKGETVWKKGSGWLTAPQFIKIEYRQGVVHLESWIKYSILPGVYAGEMDLSGGYAAVLKNSLRKKIDQLMALLQQPVEHNYSQAGPDSSFQRPIPVAVHNPKGKSTLALIFGILSAVGVLVPLAGVVLSVLGIINARIGMKSTSKAAAVIGMILSIFFLVITIVYQILIAIGTYETVISSF